MDNIAETQNPETTLPPEALAALNEISRPSSPAGITEADKLAAKTELLAWCSDFISRSKAWRAASYETKWRLYQNNCDSILDSKITSAKEPWQSKAFVPITASHKETIQAHIFKVIAGINPPVSVESRFDLGEIDQSRNIQDIIVRELDKSRWAVEFNKALDDACTLGSGFLRLYFVTETAKRKLRKEVKEGFSDNIDGLNPRGIVGYAVRAARNDLRVVGYQDIEEEVITYRGVKIRHYTPWDIFPDPKALKIDGNTAIGCRFKITYGDIVAGIKEGYYFPESADKLMGVKPEETYPQGQAEIQGDREIQDASIPKTDYGVVHDAYEIFGKFPAKWISVINGEQPEDPEEMIPARVMFHPNCVLAAEVSGEYDQEPPILKLDYLPRNGEFYAVGIPQMLLDSQAVINEVVNQRLDNGAILLNKSFGVNEKALINPKQDLKSKPGMLIRMDGTKVPNGDIRNALMELPMNDTPVRAGFSEANEAERWAQERTSANRVTLGTAGLVKDANQTLGGQQMLKESAGDKFSFIGLLMELDFLQKFYHQVWKLAYRNLTPEDVINSIGPERFKSFILITPEELQRDYVYKPLGIFTMGSKMKTLAATQAIREQFKGAPWIDDEKFFDKECQLNDLDPESFKLDESQILEQQAGMIQPGGGAPAAQVDLTGQPLPQA